jgi:hypothetical protein
VSMDRKHGSCMAVATALPGLAAAAGRRRAGEDHVAAIP